MKRSRLPLKPTLVMDEKLVNLLRYYQMFDDEMAKPQKNPIHVSSMMGEMNLIEAMIVERLRWLFHDQFPRSKFIWGAVKKFKTLPDKMPAKLQFAVKQHKERSGL